MPTPRWFTDTDEGHSTWYRDRFRDLEAEGADLEGEARFVDALAPRRGGGAGPGAAERPGGGAGPGAAGPPGARILDAGCGAGRLGGALHHRGHDVVGSIGWKFHAHSPPEKSSWSAYQWWLTPIGIVLLRLLLDRPDNLVGPLLISPVEFRAVPTRDTPPHQDGNRNGTHDPYE